MKKLLILLLLIVLFSCEKDDHYCWVCKVDSVTMIDKTEVGRMSFITYPCGITPREMFDYEGTKINTIDLWQTGYICIYNMTTVSTIKCKRNN